MCGLSGVYRFDGSTIDDSMLRRMCDATRHRGPDDEGIFCQGPVGLTHNRLSILDLSPRGHQPMHDPVGGNWIVFNGEIYNFKEVREQLAALGAVFESSGDTEVILRAYREWGEACLDRLNGMFAFAIFSEKTKTLFIARDRIGIKPLYYYSDDKQIVFASETKAVLRADGVARRINRDKLPEAIAFRFVTGGATLFENIHELEPGCCLVVGPSGVTKRRYWDVPAANGNDTGNAAQLLDELDRRLKQSVRYQLIADVPVGCALSGGVDSSLVTAMSCEVASAHMKSFTIGFDLPEFDERPHAQFVSSKLGIENFSEPLHCDEFQQRLPELAWHMDEPINHPNSVGIWLLAKTARRHVTVLLSGEGGDELMGGYLRYRNCLKMNRLQRWLPFSRTLAGLVAPGLKGRSGRIARELSRDEDGMLIWSSAYMPGKILELVLGNGATARAEASRREILRGAAGQNLVNRHLYLDLKTYLVSLLMRIDKMCMAHSLENRVPLLDHTVVEFARSLPMRLKVSSAQGKIGLYELAARRFGRSFFNRPKVGFGIPTPYFRNENVRFIQDLVASKSFRERELVRPEAIKGLIELHQAGREMPVDALWILGMIELWARTFIDKPGVVAA